MADKPSNYKGDELILYFPSMGEKERAKEILDDRLVSYTEIHGKKLGLKKTPNVNMFLSILKKNGIEFSLERPEEEKNLKTSALGIDYSEFEEE